MESPLKWQTRVISCFPSGEAYAVGSVEGRVGIQYALSAYTRAFADIDLSQVSARREVLAETPYLDPLLIPEQK